MTLIRKGNGYQNCQAFDGFKIIAAPLPGYDGTIQIKWSDGLRYRIETGYIGEKGLKPNVKYRLNASHQFEEVTL